MTEWWTYRPSDFLMFSPRIYWRLFQSINEAFWPLQPLLLAAGLVSLGLSGRVGAAHAVAWRAAALLLAACWALVAWAFLLERFAPINGVATAYAAAFGLQALGLLLLALTGGVSATPRGMRRRAGFVLALWALLGHPLLAVASGRPWQQAEVFGLAPDPTAIGSLGCLLLVRADTPWARALLRALWIVPLAWCAISAATLATMGSAQAALLLAAGALAVLAVLLSRR